MVTVQTADNALKSYYLDAISESLDFKSNAFLSQIEKTSAFVTGKDVKKAVRTTVSGGIVSGTEVGNLPQAINTKTVQLTASLKNLYGTIEITDKAIRASANNEGAFVNLLNDEMQALLKNAQYNFGRMLYGDGNGYLAEVISIDENDITVNNPQAFVAGMTVKVVNEGGYSDYHSENLLVNSVDYETGVINVTNMNSDEAISDYVTGGSVYIYGNGADELTGLKAIFGDGDLYGLKRNGNPWLVPYKQTEAGEISESKVQKAIDTIEMRSGSKVNFIVCSWGVRRALAEHFRKYTGAMPSLECAGGFKALSFNGIPVIADRFCPTGTMYLLNTDDFKLCQLCDWKWLEGEDGKVLKQIAGKPVYTATLVKYAELLCERPCGQGMISGITEA